MIYTETAVTGYLAAWCEKNLGRHDSSGVRAYHRFFAAALDAKRGEQLTEHSNAGRFGMSGAGGCLRRNALRRAGVPGKPTDGDSAVTFEIGHLLECMAIAVLQAAGFAVTRQQETVHLDPAFQSAIDGVLESGPVKLEYPLLLSVKTASYKSSSPPRGKQPAKRYGFAQLPLDGIRAAQPSWYVQSQLEMFATGIPRVITLVVAKDMIAAFRGDDTFEASGSLSWYAETLTPNENVRVPVRVAHEETLRVTDAMKALAAQPVIDPQGVARYVKIPSPGDVESGWGGPNQDHAAGVHFNLCYSCAFADICGGRDGKPQDRKG